MRNSSAKQLAFDYEQPAAVTGGSAQSLSNAVTTPYQAGVGKDQPIPNRYDPVFAASSRIAGNINAASSTEEEYQALLRERQRLLDKRLGGTAERKELNRLEYVRWSLDRIEHARHGQALEVLESAVARYETVLDDLRSLGGRLQAELPSNRR
jgi:hypothetical protein